MSTTPASVLRLTAVLVAGALATTGLAACTSGNEPKPTAQEILDAKGAPATSPSGGSAGGAETTQAPTTTTTAKPEPTTKPAEPAQPTQQASAAAGKAVFTQNCGACHTLKAAGTNGAVGPNLTNAKLADAQVLKQVTNGGGGMPAFKGQLSDAQIKAVALYVSQNDGS